MLSLIFKNWWKMVIFKKFYLVLLILKLQHPPPSCSTRQPLKHLNPSVVFICPIQVLGLVINLFVIAKQAHHFLLIDQALKPTTRSKISQHIMFYELYVSVEKHSCFYHTLNH